MFDLIGNRVCRNPDLRGHLDLAEGEHHDFDIFPYDLGSYRHIVSIVTVRNSAPHFPWIRRVRNGAVRRSDPLSADSHCGIRALRTVLSGQRDGEIAAFARFLDSRFELPRSEER